MRVCEGKAEVVYAGRVGNNLPPLPPALKRRVGFHFHGQHIVSAVSRSMCLKRRRCESACRSGQARTRSAHATAPGYTDSETALTQHEYRADCSPRPPNLIFTGCKLYRTSRGSCRAAGCHCPNPAQPRRAGFGQWPMKKLLTFIRLVPK